MTNLTDPALAPLVARYRSWVETENNNIRDAWLSVDREAVEYFRPWDEAREAYASRPWWLRIITVPPRPRGFFKYLFPGSYITETDQGFLDWAIREGIEVPKGEG
jgi:hypothetical protein